MIPHSTNQAVIMKGVAVTIWSLGESLMRYIIKLRWI